MGRETHVGTLVVSVNPYLDVSVGRGVWGVDIPLPEVPHRWCIHECKSRFDCFHHDRPIIRMVEVVGIDGWRYVGVRGGELHVASSLGVLKRNEEVKVAVSLVANQRIRREQWSALQESVVRVGAGHTSAG